MSLSYILKYRYGNIARDYLNLELRHHQMLLFIVFIFYMDFFIFTAAKLQIFFESANFLPLFFMIWCK